MIAFEVKDMTCGHCVSTITQAIRAVDEQAILNITLADHRIEIHAPGTDGRQLSEAIRQAGYTPVMLAGDARNTSPPKARGGCCCG